MRIRVSELCPSSTAYREDGEVLRTAILANWSDERPLDVDFEGRSIASVSFFDEAIAVLFLEYASDLIRRRINILGLSEPDRALLNNRIAHRCQQLQTSSEQMRS